MAFKNIIFDLGGVILDIDYHRTIVAFQNLGFLDFDTHYTQAKQAGVFDDFEVGKILPEEFISSLQKLLPENTSPSQITAAWNAMLLDWSPERLDFIRSLQSRYQLYLFSNTNAIHKAHFEKTLFEQLGMNTLDELFIKTYYSHEFGQRKPHPESFQSIIDDNQLLPHETLFIDDSIQHIEGAKAIGIQAVHLCDKSILELGL